MNDIAAFLQPHADRGARLVTDSRQVNSGDVFIAVPGASFDGRDFIPAAVTQGAAAVLCEADNTNKTASLPVPELAVPELRAHIGAIADRYYACPSSQLEMVAVTGTKGKTTSAVWCAQLLSSAGMRTAYVGTLGTGLIEEDLSTSGLTTPDAVELHGLFADFVRQGCKAVTLEASSHGLKQDRLAGVKCDIAVFTNLGHDHLDYHVDSASYLQSKILLFQRPELTGAVINADDPYADSVATACSAEVLMCGMSANCDVRYSCAADGRMQLSFDGQTLAFSLPVPGQFNAANAALAASAALLIGVSWSDLKKGLDDLRPVPGRMQRVGEGDVIAYVDYAHTPESLAAALTAVRASHPDTVLICVFGCGGNRDQTKRHLMGEVAARLADRVIVTTDNPRDEDPGAIAAEVATGAAGHVEVIIDRRAAIAAAVASAAPGAAILVAGKGDERVIIGPAGTMKPFRDAEILAQELQVQ